MFLQVSSIILIGIMYTGVGFVFTIYFSVSYEAETFSKVLWLWTRLTAEM